MLNTSVSLNSYLFQHFYTKYIKQLLETMIVDTFFCMTQHLFIFCAEVHSVQGSRATQVKGLLLMWL